MRNDVCSPRAFVLSLVYWFSSCRLPKPKPKTKKTPLRRIFGFGLIDVVSLFLLLFIKVVLCWGGCCWNWVYVRLTTATAAFCQALGFPRYCSTWTGFIAIFCWITLYYVTPFVKRLIFLLLTRSHSFNLSQSTVSFDTVLLSTWKNSIIT